MVRVRISEGLIEGELLDNDYGSPYYSFKGIPYAQPPVGDLRFKEPKPPKTWEGIRSAKRFGPKPFQLDITSRYGNIEGSEDCLYINVYTPNLKPDKPLPVMFWIYGGGFCSGSGENDMYGPEFLLRDDVIIVTFNYRLGALGFLCLETEDIPGNVGMKDQVAALRWVNKNIANFGGDPNNVTIFGESAGGMSITYHTVSPMSQGLFKRAISQSGTFYSFNAQASKPRERAQALARQLGCYTEDDKELYEFFKNAPLESFLNILVPIHLSEKAKGVFEAYFNIVPEKDYGNNEIFFTGDFTAIHEGIDIMVGYCADEGVMTLTNSDHMQKQLEHARDYPEFFITRPLSMNLTVNQQYELGKKIRNFYFNGPIKIPEDWMPLAKFQTMDLFVHGVFRYSKVCARRNKTYLFQFSCKTERNITTSQLYDLIPVIGDTPVTCHIDDLLHLFNTKLIPTKVDMNSETFKIMEKVVKLWTNFAKYGNPTPDDSLGVKWKNFTPDVQDYLDIGNKFVPGTAPKADEQAFWNSIYEEYGQKLY